MKDLLERAIELAVIHHKGGNPYILHPLAVMQRVNTLEEKIVGVCHDLVEDTPITFDDLRKEGFPEHIIEGIAAVTRVDGEDHNIKI
ncbi:hypothetical protein [Bacillus massiliigorillae]|uniref:hypothetical protein n=1 Tax=Bacillus massiliigorillae TaxID=1243664 RepID=UPI00039E1422|nr:hypothetical protein [Bacillus massiliigorillae]